MEDHSSIPSDFCGLFNFLFDRGTRAEFTPEHQGNLWTAEEFARACGVEERTVNNWRSCETLPSRDTLIDIEGAFFGDVKKGHQYNEWRALLRKAHAYAQRASQKTKKNKTTDDNPIPVADSTNGIADKLVLNDPRAEGRHLRATARFDDRFEEIANSLIAKFEKDGFLERAADQEFLSRFLGSGASDESPQQFRWGLITGPGGAGKTRLAIQFLESAEKQKFRVGFLELENLKKFDARSWRPTRPTFIVIDYAAQSPNAVAQMLKGFVTTACEAGFSYSVRVLLLEREATGDWFKTIAPTDSTGPVVRSFCYRENKERFDYPLTPLSSNALLAIMRGRLPGGGDTELSDQLLLDTLNRIDPPARDDDWQSAPRPLFAAATALRIADMMESGDDTSMVIDELELSRLQRKDVLAWIIGREREHFWIDGYASDHRTEQQRLRIHENLLVVATMALDIPRQRYDECPEALREYLPNWETLDEDRFRRMAGGDPVRTFKRLEPDILGEFFVLDRLNSLPARESQSLVDAGLSLGGDESEPFLICCAMDFHEDWRKLGFLKPSIPGPAMRAFAQAAFELSYLLGLGQFDDFDDVAAVISDAQELADRYGDPVLRERATKALFNKGVTLRVLERNEEAIAVYDDIVSRYDTASEPGLRELVAKALVNKGHSLGRLGRNEEAIAVYDDIVSRYGTASEPVLRVEVADTLVNKGIRLGALGRNEQAIAVYDDIVSRYGTASEPGLREQVSHALVNKGNMLNALGQNDEAIAVYDDIASRYGTANELGMRKRVATALLNKGNMLNALGQNDEAIAVYDDIVSRYDTASEPALRERVANALFNKGVTLGDLGRNDEAIAFYDDVVSRYGTASEPALREQVSHALVNKGDMLNALGQNDEAIALYNDVVSRYGTANELGMRKRVATALLNKGGTLGALERNDEAIAVCDDIMSRYGTASEPGLREQVSHALVNKGDMLNALGQNDEAIAVYDDIASRYGTASEPGLREPVARALVNKGVTLGALGRNDEAIAVYDDIVSRYGTASEPALRELVAKALAERESHARSAARG